MPRRVSGLVAAVLILALAPAAQAGKKKPGKTEQADDSEKPSEGAAAAPASQSGDVERPKPIIEEDSGATPEAPKADAQGNVSFGGAKGAKGRITVKAPEADKVKIYLEGRYFGAAPRTIQKVPPGDYIIELILPGGKRVTRPVSVSSDEEALVEVAGADAAAEAKKEVPMTEEQLAKRWKLVKIVGIAGASTLVLGGILGFWGKVIVQGQYDDKLNAGPTPGMETAWLEETDDLRNRGHLLVNTANVCFVLGGAAIATAVILGYPVYKARQAGTGRKTEGGLEPAPPPPPPVSFMFLPGRTTSMAGLTWTF